MTTSGDGVIRLWEPVTGKTIKSAKTEGYTVADAQFWHDDEYLIVKQQKTTNADTVIQIRDANDLELLHSIELGYAAASVMEGDSDSALVCDLSGEIYRIFFEDGEFTHTVVKDTSSIIRGKIIPGSGCIVTLNANGVAYVWDRDSNRINQSTHPGATKLAVSPDGSIYAVTTRDDGQTHFHWSQTGNMAAPTISHGVDPVAVSYTHLTLPTIYSV